MTRHADPMTTTGVGNGIEDEPVSMAVEPEWRLDRQGDKETELWLQTTGLVILGGKQPQLGSKSCKVEIDGAEV